MGLQAEFDFGIKLHKGAHSYLMFDKYTFGIAGNVDIEKEVLFGEVVRFKVEKAGNDKDRKLPISNALDMTEDDYQLLWFTLTTLETAFVNVLNDDVFAKGIPLPYWNLELLSHLTFRKHAVIVALRFFYAFATNKNPY